MDARPPRPLPPPSRRRDKPQSVCNSCRRGKLRCDRAQPCGNCARRGLSSSCAYASHNGVQSRSTTAIESVGTELAERVKQLEKLITSMVSNPTTNVSMDLDPEQVVPAHQIVASGDQSEVDMQVETALPLMKIHPGILKQDNSSTTYVESTHWTAILDEISEVKESIQNLQTQSQRFLFAATVSNPSETDVIFGNYPLLNKQQLIAALPPRATVDMVVNEYFNNKCIDSVIIHKPSFLAHYERFWDLHIGTASPIIWITLLYAITALAAAHFDQPTPLLPDPKIITQAHQEKVIQGLILGKYNTSPPFTVEALLIFLQTQILRKQETDINTSILVAMIIKLAVRQGYHRDATHFPHVTALEGEMRRRVWFSILQLDAQTAISSGLPRSLRPPFYDTAEPSNLLDGDFHTDDEMLPLSRAEKVFTPAQFLVVRNRMLAVYGNVSDAVNGVVPMSYDEVMALDMSIHNTYASIPTGLKMRALPPTTTGEITDVADVVIKRIYIALIMHEAKCVLHHRFLSPDEANTAYAHSRNTCISSALEILTHQQHLETETQASGRLFQERWRLDRRARNSFLLATSVLCRYLTTYPTIEADQSAGMGIGRREDIMAALGAAHKIWSRIEAREESIDAARAARAIGVVFKIAHRSGEKGAAAVESGRDGDDGSDNHNSNQNTGLASIHSLLMQNAAVDYTGIWARQDHG